VLGLGMADWQPEKTEIPSAVVALVEERAEARENRDFAESDRIRDELMQMGYRVEDTPDGVQIKPI